MADLEKVIRTWKHILSEDKGSLGKTRVLVEDTLECLMELQKLKGKQVITPADVGKVEDIL